MPKPLPPQNSVKPKLRANTYRTSINHTMDEIFNMRHMARELQSTLHTRLAATQHCHNTDIPSYDPIDHAAILAADPAMPGGDRPRGLDLPRRFATEIKDESLKQYTPEAAATRYAQVLEKGIFQPELNMWDRLLSGTPAAYDFNHLAVDAGLQVKGVVVTGLKWKHHILAREGEQVEHVDACKMLTGSVMPRLGIGKTSIAGYPRPTTQPAFIRYIASQPFKRMIIVNLSPAGEENVPKSARPSYRHIITRDSIELGAVLLENTVSSEDRQKWAAINAQWKRYLHNHAENDVTRGAGLQMAKEQIETVPDTKSVGPDGDGAGHSPQASRGIRRAEPTLLEDCDVNMLQGFIGQMSVLHLQITDEAVQKGWKDRQAAHMRLILRYLLPKYEGTVAFSADQSAGEDTGMMLISQGGHDRSGATYIALRYLDSVLHMRDPLDLSELSPALPEEGIENLPHWQWHDPDDHLSHTKDTITAFAPRKAMSIPGPVQELTPHLVPMMRLIDQTAEFRNFTTTDTDRKWLYDLVEIVMQHGLPDLEEDAVWRKQAKSMHAKGELDGAEGKRCKPWRSVWYENDARCADELTVKRARAAIRGLEKDARG